MKSFIFGKWHAWQGAVKILLSNEETKEFRSFDDTHDCINWLYITADDKPAARALNNHIKAN